MGKPSQSDTIAIVITNESQILFSLIYQNVQTSGRKLSSKSRYFADQTQPQREPPENKI